MSLFKHAGAAVLAISTIVAAGAASAAPIPGSAPIIDWQGFYAGAVGAYGSGNTTAAFSAPTSAPDIRPWAANNVPVTGGLLGLTLGYNFQPMGNAVFGIEGDVSWGRLAGSSFLPRKTTGGPSTPGYNPNDTQGYFQQTYFATLRARLGWTTPMMGNPTLFYFTAGLAASDGYREITNVTVGRSTATATHTGWAFGGGVESMINGQWSWKAEVLYADLGTQHYQHSFSPVITDVHLTDTLFRFGINKHF